MLFAGKELAGKIDYLRNQGKELNLSIKYPKKLEFFIRLYISLFGIPEIGFQDRFDFFQKCFKDLEGKVFIDAGCGNGAYSRFIAHKYPKSKVLAFDFEKKLVLLAKQLTNEKNVDFFVQDLTVKNSKLSNKADVLWTLDVLEHVRDYKKGVKNLVQMIKKNGYLILHVPLINQRRWFKYFKNWTHETHAREGFEKKQIIELLTEFKIIKEINTIGTLGSFIWELNVILFKVFPPLAALMFPLLRMLMLVDRIIPSKKYNAFGLLAQKK